MPLRRQLFLSTAEPTCGVRRTALRSCWHRVCFCFQLCAAQRQDVPRASGWFPSPSPISSQGCWNHRCLPLYQTTHKGSWNWTQLDRLKKIMFLPMSLLSSPKQLFWVLYLSGFPTKGHTNQEKAYQQGKTWSRGCDILKWEVQAHIGRKEISVLY